MRPEKLIQQQAESALQHRTSRRGLFRGAGKGAAGLAIGGVAASLGALLFSSCYPGRSNAITGKAHAVLAARRDGYRDWNPIPYGDAPVAGVEWVKLQGDPASTFAQVGNPDRYAGDTYRTSQICDLAPMSTAVGQIAEVTAQYPGSYAIATKFQHKDTNEIVEEAHYVDVRPRTRFFGIRGVAVGFETDGGNLASADHVLNYLVNLNANFVSIQTTIDMATRTSTELAPFEGPEHPLDFLGDLIDLAHSKGLAVLLKPHLVVEFWSFFSGHIKPTSWPAWFASYTQQIERFASVAEERVVEMFSVGNEIDSSLNEFELWANLVEATRGIYGGLLTYAPTGLHNPGNKAFSEPELLDRVGINGYLPGSGDGVPWEPMNGQTTNPTTAEMHENMQRVTENTLQVTVGAVDRPKVILENGIEHIDGANAFAPGPWEGRGDSLDNDEPTRYAEASMRFYKDIGAEGQFQWTIDLTAEPVPYRLNDFRGKPLEEALRLWYA